MVFSTALISRIEFIGGGWEGGGWGRCWGVEAEGRLYHRQGDVFSVGDRNSHNQPGRPRRSLAAVISVPQCLHSPVVDHCGFTGLAKDCL